MHGFRSEVQTYTSSDRTLYILFFFLALAFPAQCCQPSRLTLCAFYKHGCQPQIRLDTIGSFWLLLPQVTTTKERILSTSRFLPQNRPRGLIVGVGVGGALLRGSLAAVTAPRHQSRGGRSLIFIFYLLLSPPPSPLSLYPSPFFFSLPLSFFYQCAFRLMSISSNG